MGEGKLLLGTAGDVPLPGTGAMVAVLGPFPCLCSWPTAFYMDS